MASISSHISILSILLFFTFLFSTPPVFSADPPKNSPSPSPNPPADGLPLPPLLSPSTPSKSPSPSPSTSPAPSLSISSPPAPPPSDVSPSPSPAPSPALTNVSASDKAPTPSPSPSPAPAPAVEADASHEEMNASNMDSKADSGGMNRGEKAGVAVAVVAGACVVGIGALVYKKRQQNVRRAQFGYDARREIL